MQISSKKGFTLVEVMIVVGIIAILAGIFLVGSGQFRNSANDAAAKANVQKLVSYAELYYTRNSEYPTAVGFETSVGGSVPSNFTYSIQSGSICTDLKGTYDNDPLITGGNHYCVPMAQ